VGKPAASIDNSAWFQSNRMIAAKPRQSLLHPVLGRLPARRVLDCVFALHPEGPILHHHIEDVVINEAADGVQYVLQDRAPSPLHARCRIIPPLVPEF
jgi:hypothetical protein